MSKKWRNKKRLDLRAEGEPSSLRICGDSEPLELLADAAPAADGKPKLKKFSMVAYTGAALKVGFGYPIIVDLAGMSVPAQQRPILRDHDTTQIVGHTEKIEVGAKQIKVSGTISGVGDAAQEVLALAGNGFPWQASIGASIEKLEFIDAGASAKVNGKTHDGPIYVARATTLGEVSFVPIGADAGTSATVAAKLTNGATIMNPFEKWLTAQGIDVAKLTAEAKAELQAAFDAKNKPVVPPMEKPSVPATDDTDATIQADREKRGIEARRVAAIDQIQAKYGPQKMTIGEGDAAEVVDIVAHAIEKGWTPERTELECLRASRPTTGAVVSRGSSDCTLESLQGAMLLRAGARLDNPAYQGYGAIALKLPAWLRAGLNTDQRQRAMEVAHRYSDMSAIDMCRAALHLDGKQISGDRTDMIHAAFSGSALTNIFTTSVNAVLLATYMEFGDNTMEWTSTTEVADFKTNERHRLAKGPNLTKLPRGGEADHYDRSDSKESYKIARYAKQFVVDEQDMIDDSMGAFNEAPVEMGRAAARLRPDLVYALLIRNAALDADSIALFHASHSNLNTSASLTHANVKAAIAAMEKQRESSVNLGLRASHLLVPSDLKHEAAQIINSSTTAWGADNETERGTLNTINSEENLRLISEPRLANGVTDPVDGAAQSGSTTTWWLVSSMGHNIEVGYRRGTGRAPQVRSFTLEQGRWGMGWDVCLDIGAKALDFRGMQKNTA